ITVVGAVAELATPRDTQPAADTPAIDPGVPDDDEVDSPPPPVESPPSPPPVAPSVKEAPKAEAPAPAPPKPQDSAEPPFRRRSDRSENELRRELAETPEFGLSPAIREALARAYATQYQSNASISMATR